METDIHNDAEKPEAGTYIPRTEEYYAKLSDYEGPLDILLHFVKEDELNIYDIPINKITKDFLGYIDYMQALDIELAGEFLLMAAELMKVKARMLIPRPEESSEDFEEDPRLTLVRKLLEYKRFKDAAEDVNKFAENAKKKFERGYNKQDPKEFASDDTIDMSLKNLTILNLIKGYRTAIAGIRPHVVHPIELLDITPEAQRDFLIDYFEKHDEVDFIELISSMTEKLEMICTFLSMLQLALEGFIEIVVAPDKINTFLLRRRENTLITE